MSAHDIQEQKRFKATIKNRYRKGKHFYHDLINYCRWSWKHMEDKEGQKLFNVSEFVRDGNRDMENWTPKGKVIKL